MLWFVGVDLFTHIEFDYYFDKGFIVLNFEVDIVQKKKKTTGIHKAFARSNISSVLDSF